MHCFRALFFNTFSVSFRYNYYMALFSVTFLLLSYQLTNIFGPVGFILANCTNMIFRIMYSTYYISRQYRPIGTNPLDGICPGKLFAIGLITAGIVCKVSEVWCDIFNNNKCPLNFKFIKQVRVLKHSVIYHILIGGVCTLATVAAWIWENKELIRHGWNKFGGRGGADTKTSQMIKRFCLFLKTMSENNELKYLARIKLLCDKIYFIYYKYLA